MFTLTFLVIQAIFIVLFMVSNPVENVRAPWTIAAVAVANIILAVVTVNNL
jgi:hypothetical protein